MAAFEDADLVAIQWERLQRHHFVEMHKALAETEKFREKYIPHHRRAETPPDNVGNEAVVKGGTVSSVGP
jgi:hypothetical protein